ncbi:efflux RND transporter permease subunit [Agrobacterium tumefaciens]|uniref:Efflux pump membrane transporter n=1 Tax=Agrobacterium tumefaciens TaxID=358 RepID=A0AA44F265_AGRTU|nr:efflux RND transporter permease subunit [Agrobacterium tumefaciens]NSL21662.1 efflux RND transporter permease subunit [Agrobacterium tumefaciens]NTC16644.1 efflux RND transporter permease subunit [Agrobacterium tumefaciens]NTC28036.1 efflux RND transporter permease subunit [Agrobacterium tumefaciens]NTC58314.1 efflux RND transporter permease subunit [Agrobacterium tumefaciens]NTC60187.1 efflux RND transporter permease subunit [Agrobacterium tumefaciens]
MARFFIDRPIFAWVVAIIVMGLGTLSILKLPISQYPTIAGPSIVIGAVYPGASAETVADTVVQIIEKEMTGLDGLRYIDSATTSTGLATITLTFNLGTDPDIAQVQVQNKLSQAEASLPDEVTRQGLTVEKSATGFLMVVGLVSEDGSRSAVDLADYLNSYMVEPISRLKGVGKVQVFGSEYAMRIWLDPQKLKYYDISPSVVTAAIRAQNAQISAGSFGAMPSPVGQSLNATVTAQSLLKTPTDFERIVLRSDTDGGMVLLRDVARAELGSENYEVTSYYDGKGSSGMAIQLASGANALETAELVKARIDQLSETMPEGVSYVIPYDTTPFVSLSIEAVLHTLIEAIVLVVLVMLLFLHNIRATLIPTLAVPVVLLGTFGIMSLLGFSINTLTMLAMVLAIGLLVDDAIVVVENVERIMRDEHLDPKEATKKSMDEISGALVGIAMVVSAVFIPMAFFGGSTGEMYKQFSVTIVSAMALSVVVAMIFTPALCATLLKPHSPEKKKGITSRFTDGFERRFSKLTEGYGSVVRFSIKRPLRMLIVFLLLAAAMVVLYQRTPTSFLPDEDQGILFTIVQTPPGTTSEKTEEVLRKVEGYFTTAESKNVESIFSVQGFSFAGQGQNMGMMFVKLKDWSVRPGTDNSAQAIAARAFGPLMGGIQEAIVVPIVPPPVLELGNSNGFTAFLQAESGQTHEELLDARNMLLGLAAKSDKLTAVRPTGVEDASQFELNIDWGKAGAVGVTAADVGSFLTTLWSGSYINDFLYAGRMKRVYVQGEPDARTGPEDLSLWRIPNANGQFVDFSTFSTQNWIFGPQQVSRYNALPAMKLEGSPAAGLSSGDAIAEMERLASELPKGFTLQWTGQSLEEKEAGAGALPLYGLALATMFLCLAALYESWTIPIAVLLAMPVGVLGALLGAWIGDQSNGVYFQVGLLTVVGLTGKNGIMIVEFARERMAQTGASAVEVIVEAAKLRFRPILMTSLAFGLGVVPLIISTGAGTGARHAIGYATFFGTVTGTLLAIVFVPVFFVIVNRVFHRRKAPALTATN